MLDGTKGATAPSHVATAHFDLDWMGRLIKLNPWVSKAASSTGVLKKSDGLITAIISEESFDIASPFEEARSEACLARCSEGRETWNEWAKSMLALQSEAKMTGAWREKSDTNDSTPTTIAYLNLAEADFSWSELSEISDFGGYVFPGDANFTNTKFTDRSDETVSECNEDLGDVSNSSGAHVTFDGCLFTRFAGFWQARFPGTAFFRGVIFHGDAMFNEAQFEGEALFSGAQFKADAMFRSAHFGHDLTITRSDDAYNEFCRMGQPTAFSGIADFTRATFAGLAQITDAIFCRQADFTAIRSEVRFTLARSTFAQTPSFIDATFHEPPRIDDINFAEPTLLRKSAEFTNSTDGAPSHPYGPDPRQRGSRMGRLLFRFFRVARDGDEHARFRKLRKMAADANDHESATKFNAHEFVARRFWVDAPWLNGTFRFWLSWMFGLFSDYGRSISRPLVAWGLLLAFGAIFYLSQAGATSHNKSFERSIERPSLFDRSPAQWALWLAEVGSRISERVDTLEHCHQSYEQARTNEVKDGKSDKPNKAEAFQPTNPVLEAIVLSLRNGMIFDRSDVSRRMYGCLYGIQDKGGQDYPTIPPLVSIVSTLQSFLSAIFIFLFGLGVRNMFRIK